MEVQQAHLPVSQDWKCLLFPKQDTREESGRSVGTFLGQTPLCLETRFYKQQEANSWAQSWLHLKSLFPCLRPPPQSYIHCLQTLPRHYLSFQTRIRTEDQIINLASLQGVSGWEVNSMLRNTQSQVWRIVFFMKHLTTHIRLIGNPQSALLSVYAQMKRVKL